MSHPFANFDVVSSIVIGSMRVVSKCIAKRGGQKRDQSINTIRSFFKSKRFHSSPQKELGCE